MILSFLASSLAGSTPGNPRQLPGMKMYSRLNVDSTRRRRRPPFRRPYPRFSRRLGGGTVIIRAAARRPRGWQCPEPGAPRDGGGPGGLPGSRDVGLPHQTAVTVMARNPDARVSKRCANRPKSPRSRPNLVRQAEAGSILPHLLALQYDRSAAQEGRFSDGAKRIRTRFDIPAGRAGGRAGPFNPCHTCPVGGRKGGRKETEGGHLLEAPAVRRG